MATQVKAYLFFPSLKSLTGPSAIVGILLLSALGPMAVEALTLDEERIAA